MYNIIIQKTTTVWYDHMVTYRYMLSRTTLDVLLYLICSICTVLYDTSTMSYWKYCNVPVRYCT